MSVTREHPEHKKLDYPLQFINKNYITINHEDRLKYTRVLDKILDAIRKNMAEVDNVYRDFAGAVNYSGSVYDKVKVGKPDEFDLNLVMKLPSAWKYHEDIKILNSSPGYITINLNGGASLYRDPSFANKYQRGINGWIDDQGYMIQEKFHAWMEGVLVKALNRRPNFGEHITVKTKKSGPALTLLCEDTLNGIKLDVDLVPVIQFNNAEDFCWPPKPVKKKPQQCSKKTWCAVPKPKKGNVAGAPNREWRVSFSDQEKELLYNKGKMKNLIRQIKKLKSAHVETKFLPSYYVKTIFLWALHDPTIDQSIWNKWSDGELFMFMLKRLHNHLEKGEILYFWDERNNLLSSLGNSVQNMKHRIQRIIKDIENNVNDPLALARNMLTSEEFEDFKGRFSSMDQMNHGFVKLSL